MTTAWLDQACQLTEVEKHSICRLVLQDLDASMPTGGWTSWFSRSPSVDDVVCTCSASTLSHLRARDIPSQRFTDARTQMCEKFRAAVTRQRARIEAYAQGSCDEVL